MPFGFPTQGFYFLIDWKQDRSEFKHVLKSFNLSRKFELISYSSFLLAEGRCGPVRLFFNVFIMGRGIKSCSFFYLMWLIKINSFVTIKLSIRFHRGEGGGGLIINCMSDLLKLFLIFGLTCFFLNLNSGVCLEWEIKWIALWRRQLIYFWTIFKKKKN